MSQEAVLKPEEVATVLTHDDPVADATRPTVYSLRHPMAIAPADEPAARARLEGLAAVLQNTLHHELRAEIELAVQGFRQEQVAAALDAIPKPAWVLSFLAHGGGGIALALDPGCALSLVELALGGAGNNSATGRRPTPLETRVMSNLCTTLAQPLGQRTSTPYEKGIFLEAGVPAALADPGQTIGLGLLGLKVAGTDYNGLLLATPKLLVESDGVRKKAGSGPGPLVAPLTQALMDVQPVLKGAFLSLSDLTALAAGALLDLEVPEQTELYLKVNTRDAFRGHVKREPSGPVFSTTWRRGRRLSVRDGEES